jgi:5-formyltetrahydrofolate cyclo-ligase
MESIELMAVPGVAFDRNGNRLGRGGGYYDRLLAGFSGLSAGVSFDFQLFPQIPSEPHDIPVDTIVTEFGIINVLNER